MAEGADQIARLSPEALQRLADRLRHRRKSSESERRISQVDRGLPMALSYSQERLWLLEQLGLAGAAYNVGMALRLEGELKVEALERSLREVVRRHESLRTRFEAKEGVPYQLIEPAGSFELGLTDLSELVVQEREERARELIEQERVRRFDLERGPLFRASLLRLGEREHVLLLTMHHIVSDGWSLGVLNRELSVLYGAYAEGAQSPLAELEVQYADYALWQRQWLQGEVLEKQLEYWRGQLKGIETLQLPTDRARPAVASYRGAVVPFELSAEVSRGLNELARREGVTLYMLLLAAFQVLLGRYSGQRDIVVGSPIAGRSHRQTEPLIGFFINTLVMRTDLSGEPSFRQLLRRVKETTLAAYAHQDVPFERLVAELQPERDLSRQPLFQIVLALQNFPNESFRLQGLTWNRVDVEHSTEKFDVTLVMFEGESQLSGRISYATDLFERETIERMANCFASLLEQCALDPGQQLLALQMPLQTNVEGTPCDRQVTMGDHRVKNREGKPLQLESADAKQAVMVDVRGYVAPRTPIERTLVEIWAETLKVERVGVTHNFFELGGHSLLILPMVERINKQMQSEVRVVDLFKFPTIDALAKYIAKDASSTVDATDIELRTQQSLRAQREHRLARRLARGGAPESSY